MNKKVLNIFLLVFFTFFPSKFGIAASTTELPILSVVTSGGSISNKFSASSVIWKRLHRVTMDTVI